MNFADLHEVLRKEVVRRIDAGLLTGTRLAQQTGFRQAHISNFLNARRSLSLEGLDRVLEAQKLTVDQLLSAQAPSDPRHPSPDEPWIVDLAAVGIPGTSGPDPVELVPVVSAVTATAHARIPASSIIERLALPANRLDYGNSRTQAARMTWQRFVAIRVDRDQSAAMAPVLCRGSLVVLDRHYTSLAPLRSAQPNLYAVRSGPSLLLRYVDLDQAHLILRPHSLDHPIQLLPIEPPLSPADLLVGRVCVQLAEL